MKAVYPVLFEPGDDGWVVAYVPDMQINSEGKTLAEAIDNVRDAIGATGLAMEDSGVEIPVASDVTNFSTAPGEIISLVDVDFKEYRRASDLRSVRRNISLPSWLNTAAEKAGVNVSAITQQALMDTLGITKPTF